MSRRRISSWRARVVRIVSGCLSQSLVEPSTSVKRKVTVPVGAWVTRFASSLRKEHTTYYTRHRDPTVPPSGPRRLVRLQVPRSVAVAGSSGSRWVGGNTRVARERDLKLSELRGGSFRTSRRDAIVREICEVFRRAAVCPGCLR